MAGRIRSIKPEAFKDAELWDAEEETKLPLFRAFAALWCQADKEGRFVWKPRELKIECLPYWNGDFSHVLDALASRGFIVRYTSGTGEFGWIPNFKKHQHINGREPDSRLPEPVTMVEVPRPSGHVEDTSGTCEPRDTTTPVTGASREADAPIPSPSLPYPDPIPDPGGGAGGTVDVDARGRFRMHRLWRPSENSIASVRIASVQDWAVPIFTAEFVGHFSDAEEERTNPEWNQRWQKWAIRGWNDSAKRPKKPPEQTTVEQQTEVRRKREAAESAELARIRQRAKTESGVAPSSPDATKAAMENLMAGGSR